MLYQFNQFWPSSSFLVLRARASIKQSRISVQAEFCYRRNLNEIVLKFEVKQTISIFVMFLNLKKNETNSNFHLPRWGPQVEAHSSATSKTGGEKCSHRNNYFSSMSLRTSAQKSLHFLEFDNVPNRIFLHV